ncbi:hypothetical protein D3C77_614060 [compost metagenome]
MLPGHFLIAQAPGNPGWRTDHQRLLGAGEARLDQGASRDDRARADAGVVQDHGIDTDQRISAHPAAMQHRAVTDMAVALDHRITVGETMHDTGVLQVGALLQHDPAEITAQAGQRTDVAPRANNHVADQYGARVYIGTGVDHRREAVKAVAGHGESPRSI